MHVPPVGTGRTAASSSGKMKRYHLSKLRTLSEKTAIQITVCSIRWILGVRDSAAGSRGRKAVKDVSVYTAGVPWQVRAPLHWVSVLKIPADVHAFLLPQASDVFLPSYRRAEVLRGLSGSSAACRAQSSFFSQNHRGGRRPAEEAQYAAAPAGQQEEPRSVHVHRPQHKLSAGCSDCFGLQEGALRRNPQVKLEEQLTSKSPLNPNPKDLNTEMIDSKLFFREYKL